MKRLVITLMTVMLTVVVSAQDVKVEFITPSIVHIVKGQPTKTLVITAKPQDAVITQHPARPNGTLSSERTPPQRSEGAGGVELLAKLG